ncbi:ADYC domain-containing protein [Sorangium sp. So ce1000]|uniref:ADYC domain-containing protein n=1 Tax=Sorangium sp. So ce1000 TaxID=3133325 RepID=UPI003F638C44
MLKQWFRAGAMVGLIVLGAGCAAEIDGGEGEEESAESSLALRVLNDIGLNGTHLNGTRLNGVRFNGVRFNGVRFNGVTLNGTKLVGTRESDGAPVAGIDFVGADIEAVLDDLSSVTVRITNIAERSGITYYTVKYNAGPGLWVNVCGDGLDAIAMRGTWDTATGAYSDDGSKFTFACQGAAIAKCAEWGYRGWTAEEECEKGRCESRDLSYFHQACIRMVRADYCGDGVPHTQTGTAIDVWDALDIQSETECSGMSLEAEWTVGGAACVKHTRWKGLGGSNPDRDYILAHCPERWAGGDSSCGGSGSTFDTANGFATPLGQRRLLRNASFTTNVSPLL